MADDTAFITDQQDKDRHRSAQNLSWEPFVEDLTVQTLPNNGPRRVAQLFSGFVSEKLKLIQSIGFDCCLRLPVHHNIDNAFYISLLRKIDPAASCLRLGMSYSGISTQLVLTDEDVNLVLGLPHLGAEVKSDGQVSLEDVNTVRKHLFLHPRRADLTIHHIETILTRQYPSPMEEASENAFKVAAVIFTMVNFLAVHGGSDRIPIEIFGSLVDPKRIKQVNWSGHVRRTLLQEAKIVQDKLKRGDTHIQPGGCSLYAQVHYLDNIQQHGLELSERVFPRALIFSEEAISLAIRLDSTKSIIHGPRQFGQSSLKPEYDCCYSSRCLPLEYDSQCSVSKSISRKRKREEFSVEEDYLCTKNLAKRVILEASKFNINVTIYPKASLQKKQKRVSNLGIITEASIDCIQGLQNVVHSIEVPIPPFEIACNHQDSPFHKWYSFFELLKTGKISRLEIDWFVHNEPYKITIAGWALRAALIPAGYFTITVTDAILRLYSGRDNAIYLENKNRWRHFIPASWTDAALHGYFGSDLLAQMKYFVGPHILYDLRNCRMFPAPVILDGCWSCYFWDMKEKEIIVLDPQMQRMDIELIKNKHRGVVKTIHKALISVLNELFPDWEISGNNWKKTYRNDVSTRCKWADSGLYTLHYASTFDGLVITEEIKEGYLHNRRAKFVWMLLAMRGNSGIVPHQFGTLMYGS